MLPALLIMGLGFGMIFAPAINTATAGVARQDSGVASALVNTMQQVGGSIGTSALSTIALTATASYLAAHHARPAGAGRSRPPTATPWPSRCPRGYSQSASILAIVLLPSRRRLEELRNPAPAPAAAAPPGSRRAPAPPRSRRRLR